MIFDPDATLLKIFTDPETISDPYPLYAELREHAPIFKTELVGRWVLTRFDDARALLRDPRCGSGAGLTDERVSLDGTKRKVRSGTLSMLMLNPPDHTRVRGLVARSFTPRRVEKLRPEVEQMCDDLLDDLGGEGDFVGSVAFPLPANVISALVGVPAEYLPYLRPLIYDLTVGIEQTASPEDLAAAEVSGAKLTEYLQDLVARRRAEPQDDLLSGMIQAADGEDKLTESEVLVNTSLIYAAGFETTTHLLGNAVRQLVAHPDQLELLRNDRSLIPQAIEEVLRYDPPVQVDGRHVFEDIEIDGVTIPAGSSTMTLLGACNRDPALVEDPERFDVTRTDTQVLSFGSGIHYCLGAALARLEGEALLGKLLDRYEHWEITEEPAWRNRMTLRGVDALQVRFR